MKKLLILAFCAVFLVVWAGCTYVVINKEEIPTPEMALELTAILNGISYGRYYEEGVFDCSNQTAFLYDVLTTKGYKCEIMMATFSIWTIGSGHAWLIAGKEDKKFWIEAVMKKIVQPDFYDEFPVRICVYSLKFLRVLFAIFGYPHEWDY